MLDRQRQAVGAAEQRIDISDLPRRQQLLDVRGADLAAIGRAFGANTGLDAVWPAERGQHRRVAGASAAEPKVRPGTDGPRPHAAAQDTLDKLLRRQVADIVKIKQTDGLDAQRSQAAEPLLDREDVGPSLGGQPLTGKAEGKYGQRQAIFLCLPAGGSDNGGMAGMDAVKIAQRSGTASQLFKTADHFHCMSSAKAAFL